MRLSSGERFITALIAVAVTCIVTLTGLLVAGCDGGTGSLIAIDGNGGAGGSEPEFDVCAVEGVEDCCPDFEPVICPPVRKEPAPTCCPPGLVTLANGECCPPGLYKHGLCEKHEHTKDCRGRH